MQKRGVLFAIVATGRESESLRSALGCYLPDATIVDFPSWETLPHERLSPSAETVGKRAAALRLLHEHESGMLVVVASVRAALQPMADNLVDFEPVVLTAGGRGYDLAQLSSRLVDLAYSRVDLVTRRGEFAVRGGILDVFPPTEDHPVRVEFFGDELEQLRQFSVSDQRSLPEVVQSVALPPSRELLLSPAVRQRAREMQHEFPSLATLLAKSSEGIPVEGMESLAPALLDRLVPITHYLPSDAAIAILSPERITDRAHNLVETNKEFLSAAWNAATVGAEAPIDLDAGEFLTLGALRDSAGGRPWWTFSQFNAGALPEEDAGEYLRIEANPVPSFAGVADGALAHVENLLKDGWSVVVAAQGSGLVERAADVLAERGLAARPVEALPSVLETGVAYIAKASVEQGFELAGVKLALLSESEFFGRSAGYDTRQPKKLASRRKNVVDPLQLKTGDYVVHQTHGVGKFLELVSREVSSGGRNPVKRQREFLVLEYAPNKRGYPGDKLYVPTDQLDLITRYVGGEAPAVSKMGGSDWAAAKGKARKAVRDIAVELVKLYSALMSS